MEQEFDGFRFVQFNRVIQYYHSSVKDYRRQNPDEQLVSTDLVAAAVGMYKHVAECGGICYWLVTLMLHPDFEWLFLAQQWYFACMCQVPHESLVGDSIVKNILDYKGAIARQFPGVSWLQGSYRYGRIEYLRVTATSKSVESPFCNDDMQNLPCANPLFPPLPPSQRRDICNINAFFQCAAKIDTGLQAFF